MGEMYLSAEDFERDPVRGGFVSCSFYKKEKKKKSLLYSLMSKIRQIAWYLKEKTFFVVQKRLLKKLLYFLMSTIFQKEMREMYIRNFLERNFYPSMKLAS